MTIMGQPDSVWRLIGRPWNSYVRRFLKMLRMRSQLPEMVFLGELARVRVFRIMRRKRKLELINTGSATPIITFMLGSSMSLEQQVDNAKTNLFEQKHGSRFDSCQVVPPYYIRRNNDL